MAQDVGPVAATTVSSINETLQHFEVAHLCDWCSNVLIDQRLREPTILRHYPIGGPRSLGQLKAASLASCPICSTVYRAACGYEYVNSKNAEYDMTVYYKDNNALPSFYVDDCTAPYPIRWEFELVPFTDIALDGYQHAAFYDYPRHSADPMVASLIQSWLSDCSSQHTLCGRQTSAPYHPPRLIEITSDSIKLVTSKNLDIVEAEAPYATLSHCWGTNPTFLTLTEQNSRRLHDQIHLHELPKTFQDAILLCQRLGLRYLWIDSVCILQKGEGSKADWLLHVTEMRNVYRNCFVNIAASRAADATQGLYTERMLQNIKPWRVNSMGDGLVPPGQFLLMHQSISTHRWIQAPLTKRGWVFQERLLSPRVIYWAPDQIFWQCSSLHACETYPGGFRAQSPHGHPFDIPDVKASFDKSLIVLEAERGLFRCWQSVVYTYSTCRLTYPDLDKLPAMAGIAEEFARLFSDVYVAGFFKRQLPEALLWTYADYNPLEMRSSSSTYRCPSWSWAKMNTAVAPHVKEFDLHESLPGIPLADLADTYIELHDPSNAFGRLNSADLVIRGRVVPFHWDLSPPTGDDSEIATLRRPFESSPALGPGININGIYFDYANPAYKRQGDAYFLAIEFLPRLKWVKGLVLHIVERSGQQVYERIGMATLTGLDELEASEMLERFEKVSKEEIVLI